MGLSPDFDALWVDRGSERVRRGHPGRRRRARVVLALLATAAVATALAGCTNSDDLSVPSSQTSVPESLPLEPTGSTLAQEPPGSSLPPATVTPESEPQDTRQQSRPTEAPPKMLPAAGDPIPPNVLIFTRLQPDGIRQLVSLDLSRAQDDPLRVQTVPTGAGPLDHLPALSRDRRLIAYTTQLGTGLVLAVAAWSGGEKLLTIDGNPVGVANDARATWSPDGTRLAYVANRNGRDDLFVYDTNTRSEVRLTEDDLSEADPSWSPISDDILYSVATSNESGLDIMRVSVSDGVVVRLTSVADDDSDPSWSPDATKIAFARRGRGEGSFTQLFVMDSDGSNARPVLAPSSAPDVYNDSDPSWSPDGLQIAFESDRDKGLWVADAAQPATPRSLLDDPEAILIHPAWS